MAKNKQPVTPAKQRVTVELPCDTGKLYSPLSVAIAYLNAVRAEHPYPDLSLDEQWTGYEDMHMAFTYSREETDEEFAARLEQARLERAQAEATIANKKKRDADIAAYNALKRKLGL